LRDSLGSSNVPVGETSERGQAFVETVLSTGFLVAMAIAINKLLRPVLVEAFEAITLALSSVAP